MSEARRRLGNQDAVLLYMCLYRRLTIERHRVVVVPEPTMIGLPEFIPLISNAITSQLAAPNFGYVAQYHATLANQRARDRLKSLAEFAHPHPSP